VSEDEINKLIQNAINDFAATMMSLLHHAHASTMKCDSPNALRMAASASIDKCTRRVKGNRGKSSPITAADAKLIMVAVCRECIRIVEGGTE
jgi:hypothetical protein